MDINHHVGVLKTHTGTTVSAKSILEKVDYTVLHAVSHKTRISEYFRINHRVNGKSLVDRHNCSPVKLLGHLVESVGVIRRELHYRLQYSQCRAAAQISTVHNLLVAFKGNHASAHCHILSAYAAQLVSENFFKTLKGFCNHFVSFGFH